MDDNHCADADGGCGAEAFVRAAHGHDLPAVGDDRWEAAGCQVTGELGQGAAGDGNRTIPAD